jgi:hypothetical protein
MMPSKACTFTSFTLARKISFRALDILTYDDFKYEQAILIESYLDSLAIFFAGPV